MRVLYLSFLCGAVHVAFAQETDTTTSAGRRAFTDRGVTRVSATASWRATAEAFENLPNRTGNDAAANIAVEIFVAPGVSVGGTNALAWSAQDPSPADPSRSRSITHVFGPTVTVFPWHAFSGKRAAAERWPLAPYVTASVAWVRGSYKFTPADPSVDPAFSDDLRGTVQIFGAGAIYMISPDVGLDFGVQHASISYAASADDPATASNSGLAFGVGVVTFIDPRGALEQPLTATASSKFGRPGQARFDASASMTSQTSESDGVSTTSHDTNLGVAAEVFLVRGLSAGLSINRATSRADFADLQGHGRYESRGLGPSASIFPLDMFGASAVSRIGLHPYVSAFYMRDRTSQNVTYDFFGQSEFQSSTDRGHLRGVDAGFIQMLSAHLGLDVSVERSWRSDDFDGASSDPGFPVVLSDYHRNDWALRLGLATFLQVPGTH